METKKNLWSFGNQLPNKDKQSLKCFLFCLILSFSFGYASAQSVEYAKSLINQGRYLEAAKQLRPLADEGNAEAQYWAACLFFDGKGVTKSEAQGVKYATLSADQGFLPGIYLLTNHYERINPKQYFSILSKYVSRNSKLKDDELGCKLGLAYIQGYGIDKSEEKGWEIIDKSQYGMEFLVDHKELKGDYYYYKAKQVGKNNLEDYADYLWKLGKVNAKGLMDYIYEKYESNNPNYYRQRANEGNAFAMAMVAAQYLGKKDIELAKEWANKSKLAGSVYGTELSNYLNYVPKSYTNITTTSRPKNFAIGKVTRNYETTEVDVVYSNPGWTDWITLSPDIYLSCNGRKYQLVRSSNDLNKRIIVSNRKTYTVTLTFLAIPESTNTFTMIEPNGDTWRDVTFR